MRGLEKKTSLTRVEKYDAESGIELALVERISTMPTQVPICFYLYFLLMVRFFFVSGPPEKKMGIKASNTAEVNKMKSCSQTFGHFLATCLV